MTIYAIISIARQVDGEYCLVKIEKGFKDKNRAEEESKKLAKQYAEVIQTSGGTINCVCERGVFEIDVVE